MKIERLIKREEIWAVQWTGQDEDGRDIVRWINSLQRKSQMSAYIDDRVVGDATVPYLIIRSGSYATGDRSGIVKPGDWVTWNVGVSRLRVLDQGAIDEMEVPGAALSVVGNNHKLGSDAERETVS